ncbi:MAG: hypothetical protein LQ344_001969 [Seirophora lacunosa]|nr:MAG: hypothetical protein LQ344_001969 [Seirophora lacunosa]
MITHHHLLLLLLLPTLTSAWICFPPPHLLPTRPDCAALLLGLHHMSTLPADIGAKRWSRHLPTGPRTEQLPKYFYVVDERAPPTTCAIVVDAAPGHHAAVGAFGVRDVVHAGKEVYRECLGKKEQVGLEFPGEEGEIFAKVVRWEGVPPLRGGRGRLNGGEGWGRRREVNLPGGGGVVVVLDGGPGWERNFSGVS